MTTIPMSGLLRWHGERIGRGRPALIHPEGELSWEELERRANRRARALQSRGVRPGDFVTLALPNGNLFYECSFACWKLGATPNPLSPKLPAAEFDAILDLVKPAVVVAEDPAHLPGWPRVDPAEPIAFSDEPLVETVATSWKAMTSGGSTGRPKVIVDRQPAEWDPDAPSALGQRSGEVVLNPGPLHHNAPFVISHQALFAGDTVVGMRRFHAEECLRLIQTYGVNWVTFVPTMMNRIWALGDGARGRFDVSSLRQVWHMAAPMPEWLKRSWIEWLGPERILELYGGTERQGHTVITGSEWLRKPGSVGRLASAGEIAVFDTQGSRLPPGDVGEIYFRPEGGPGSTYYYVGASPRRRADGWESLGDVGWIDAEGYVFLADRRTDLILRGGANVYPAEVEGALSEHPAVASCIVIGLPDADLGQVTHAIVESTTNSTPDVRDLHAHLRARLAPYKLPESYEFVVGPLRDEAGKARRSALKSERAEWLRRGCTFRVPAPGRSRP